VSWIYRFDERALKELKKLGRAAQTEILAYLDERIAGDADPRRFGKALKADLAGLWRYRVGSYRVLCQIRDNELVVMVVTVGHRKNVYG
jgi:mRNA interferase RelE/StbE